MIGRKEFVVCVFGFFNGAVHTFSHLARYKTLPPPSACETARETLITISVALHAKLQGRRLSLQFSYSTPPVQYRCTMTLRRPHVRGPDALHPASSGLGKKSCVASVGAANPTSRAWVPHRSSCNRPQKILRREHGCLIGV